MMLFSRPFSSWLLLLAVCMSGIASAQESQAPAAPVSRPAPAPLSEEEAANYTIGPGDVLQIIAPREEKLNITLPVRPDGKITMSMVEDMVAVGKTPSQLARDIETVLAKFIKSPQVNVIVSQPMSAFSQVKVIGQVAQPKSIAFREGMKVLDAVLAVGGLAPFASGNRAKLMRMENGKQKEIRIKLSDLLNKGDLKQNLELKPGDILVVPESMF